MKVLLHACCGPCAAGTVDQLREEGIFPVLYWNNPNIHPFQEYSLRLKSLCEFARESGFPLFVDGRYGLRSFVAQTAGDPDGRCAVCYRMRMDAAARHAHENGFDAFTSTLFVSPYQNHEKIAEAGKEAGERHAVRFLVRDFRPGFRGGQARAREMGLYMQKYCGCIYSEEERFSDRAKKLPSGFFPNFRG